VIDLESPPASPPAPPAPLSRLRAVTGRISATLRRPAIARGLTVLAALIVFAALIFPNILSRLTPVGFLRIPLEGAVVIGLMIVLPPRARRVAAVVLGVLLGWLVVEKCLDMGFFEELNRPFDPVLDWVLLDDAYGFAAEAYGRVAATAAAIAVLLLVAVVMVVTIWALLRIGALIGRRRRRSAYVAGGVAVAWVLAFTLGLSITGAVPIAARSSATYAWDRAHSARNGLRDGAAFAKEVQADAYRGKPADQMLTALAGKDVIFTFVESYGRSAVEHPALAPAITPTLAAGAETLKQAGFAARSGWLTSPTFGGGSWLAHATFESGLWINNENRYRHLVSTDRITLTSAFQAADWRTVSVMPGATRAWPEGKFYGYDTVWDSRNLGYNGPKFSWSPMPDQFTLKQVNTLEYKKPGRGPLMVELPLVSSHTPWAPIPEYLPDWNQVGDGSVYAPMVANGTKPQALWAEPRKVRAEYGKSIVYTLTTLIEWIKLYGDENLVMVFLGDHQPSPIAAGANASHDVPITIVAKDPAVLDRVDSWGWADGLKPEPAGPVWPMNAFRDRFFAAFGSG
jgi:hypothetical protein